MFLGKEIDKGQSTWTCVKLSDSSMERQDSLRNDTFAILIPPIGDTPVLMMYVTSNIFLHSLRTEEISAARPLLAQRQRSEISV